MKWAIWGAISSDSEGTTFLQKLPHEKSIQANLLMCDIKTNSSRNTLGSKQTANIGKLEDRALFSSMSIYAFQNVKILVVTHDLCLFDDLQFEHNDKSTTASKYITPPAF